jgi:hypothetical protein
MEPSLRRLGFLVAGFCRIRQRPEARFCTRREWKIRRSLPFFTYGHGDVIRGRRRSGAQASVPWTLTREGDRLYGAAPPTTKGQHTINLAALERHSRRAAASASTSRC